MEEESSELIRKLINQTLINIGIESLDGTDGKKTKSKTGSSTSKSFRLNNENKAKIKVTKCESSSLAQTKQRLIDHRKITPKSPFSHARRRAERRKSGRNKNKQKVSE